MLDVNGAAAVTPYDGAWNVMITTTSGTCDSGVGFGVHVQDGIVRVATPHGRVIRLGRISRSASLVGAELRSKGIDAMRFPSLAFAVSPGQAGRRRGAVAASGVPPFDGGAR
jgi:hypothetical protein